MKPVSDGPFSPVQLAWHSLPWAAGLIQLGHRTRAEDLGLLSWHRQQTSDHFHNDRSLIPPAPGGPVRSGPEGPLAMWQRAGRRSTGGIEERTGRSRVPLGTLPRGWAGQPDSSLGPARRLQARAINGTVDYRPVPIIEGPALQLQARAINSTVDYRHRQREVHHVIRAAGLSR